MTPQNVCGLLLAAGTASRFGGGKLTHPLPGTGEPIALRAWRNLRAALPSACVVVRAQDAITTAMFRQHQARLVISEEAALGMGHSLAAGIRANSYCEGWIIALGDMPYVRSETISVVAQAIRTNAIVIPTYHGERGHPVGFGLAYRDALNDLSGDAGARKIIQLHATDVLEIEVDDAGILADIDQREDLLKAPRATS